LVLNILVINQNTTLAKKLKKEAEENPAKIDGDFSLTMYSR